MRGVDVQPTSTTTESASADCFPVRPPSSAREVGELPVEPGVEPRREPGGDVGGEDRLREEDRLDSVLVDELRDRVDARLRQRRREPLVVGDVDRRGAVLRRPVRRASDDARADDDARDVARAELRGLREHGERALLELVAVMLEEDEDAHSEPLLREELEDLLGRAAVVLDLARVAARRRIGEREHLGARALLRRPAPASTPRSPSESCSCGFFFAPMIPFSDG